jgi:uncharacterized protein YdeI (YjbR/CyaY-like superfamily)
LNASTLTLEKAQMEDKIQAYIDKHEKWNEELQALRDVFLSTKLDETVKWGAPVYTFNGKNVAGLGAFKNHYAVWFFNGVFLNDDHKLLEAGQDKTKALRQIKLKKGETIDADVLRMYILEAAENEQKGLKVKAAKAGEYELAPKLKSVFSADAELKEAFYGLTPGKQKEYSNHVAEAKQEKTKFKRIEKITPMIMAGKGLYDKYKNC